MRACPSADLPTTEFAMLSIEQRHIARLFNVTPRHIRRWRSGDRRVPHAVGIVCNLLAMGVVTIEQVEAAVPARTNGGAPPTPRLVTPAPAQVAETTTLAQKVYALEGCRWPHNDPQSPDFHFCGAVTERGPYCEHHRRAAHLAPRADSRHGTGFLLQEPRDPFGHARSSSLCARSSEQQQAICR
jgi:hypothetical protein